MKISCEDQLTRILIDLSALTPKEREAVAWLAANYDFALALCAEALTDAQRIHHTERAVEDGDTIRLMLVLLERTLHSFLSGAG